MTKRKSQVWLVYDNGDPYEGGIEPLLVVATEALAAQAKADIEQKVASARARMERLPDPFEDGIDHEEYVARSEKRDRMLDRLRWPYGIERAPWAWDFTVGVMPLPFVQEPR